MDLTSKVKRTAEKITTTAQKQQKQSAKTKTENTVATKDLSVPRFQSESTPFSLQKDFKTKPSQRNN